MPPSPIVCVECGASSHGTAAGWKAYLAGFGGDEEIAVYCPDCAQAEFDPEGAP